MQPYCGRRASECTCAASNKEIEKPLDPEVCPIKSTVGFDWICFALSTVLLALALCSNAYALESSSRLSSLKDDATLLKSDYNNFYLNTENLLMLGAGIAASGAMANTRIDGGIQDYYHDDIRGRFTDKVSDATRLPGEIYLTMPTLLAVRLIYPETIAGEWAGRSLRALFTGGPAGLVLQYSTGAGRPREGDSDWSLFNGNNGLSGHAFIGATITPLI